MLSHKNWGSSSSLMHEVARDTFDVERFHVVTRLMWEGMENQRPAAWRIVFKALTLLEFLVKNGAERCVDDARNHGHVLRALGQFNYYEGTIDRGLGVREKSKQIMEILGDDDRIREERQKARKLRQKFGNGGAAASSTPSGQSAGYGNQDSWNTGGGYGQGGVDSSSPYESGGGYSGRYAGSRDGDSAPAPTAPTFAAIPDNKPKKIKKKKKKPENESSAPAPAPAAAEIDLFSFDDPSPAPAPVTTQSNDDFGAFQTTAAPAPAVDDDFGAFVASKASQPDPFGTPAPAPMASSFDAFGNNNTFSPNNAMAGNMQNVATAFGNMTVGQTQQMQAPATTDDEFGDFADAGPKSPSAVLNSTPSDPLAKLVSLDGLSKNPRNNVSNQNANKGMNFGGMGNMGMGNMGGMNSQNMNAGMNMNMNPGMNMNMNANMNPNMQSVPNVVAAGGRDAISSLMGPAPVGIPQGMGMQAQMAQPHQQGAMNPQMMQQGGVQNLNPHMMGNQMAGMQNNMMGNQMLNPMQQGTMMTSVNPNMMGGQMMGNMMGPMQGNMMGGQPVNGMQGNMMGGQMMGGMPGNMQGNMMNGQMGTQWR